MMYAQLGRDLSDGEIVRRLVMSFADNLTMPVHFVPAVRILPECKEWPRRGVMA